MSTRGDHLPETPILLGDHKAICSLARLPSGNFSCLNTPLAAACWPASMPAVQPRSVGWIAPDDRRISALRRLADTRLGSPIDLQCIVLRETRAAPTA